MELTYLTDHLFDLLNESDLLDLIDITPTADNSGFHIVTADGSKFTVTCKTSNE